MMVRKLESKEGVAEIPEIPEVLQLVENHMMMIYPKCICNLSTKNHMNSWTTNQLRKLKLKQDLLMRQTI